MNSAILLTLDIPKKALWPEDLTTSKTFFYLVKKRLAAKVNISIKKSMDSIGRKVVRRYSTITGKLLVVTPQS